jgi:hypothetical protein
MVEDRGLSETHSCRLVLVALEHVGWSQRDASLGCSGRWELVGVILRLSQHLRPVGSSLY